MKAIPKSNGRSGLTTPELIAAIVIVAIFIWFGLFGGTHCGGVPLSRSQATQMLSHMKQLHLATQQMALDGTTTGDSSLCWPSTNSFHSWATNLVPAYLSTNDFALLMSGRRKSDRPWYQKLWSAEPVPVLPGANTNAILVYGASEASDGSVIFLSSANFANSPTGGALDSSSTLLSNKCFIVFHKGGDGAVLLPKQVGRTNVVGTYAPLLR